MAFYNNLNISPDLLQGAGLLTAFGLLSVSSLRKTRDRNARRIDVLPVNNDKMDLDFDTLIVGAGPAGATAAYYGAKSGLKVGLFDKKTFPRYKPCGDAWCAGALHILEDMNVLQKMESDGIARPVKRGGLISPFGYQCINTDGASYGSVTGCKTYAIKREIADEYLVRAAASVGANLYEGTEIVNAEFKGSFWLITVRNEEKAEKQYKARMLLICDGSTSYLAQKLGILKQGSQPQAVCSTGYIQNNAWKDADGVMIFTKSVLPGYSALFRHYNDDMYLGTYILPGGSATSKCIAPFETEAMEKHPYIKEALGNDYQWRKKRTVAPIRMGGVEKSYGDQALLVGDAAGHVDPLTGEGIHTAMIAGKIAAECCREMFTNNNFTEQACKAYELRCYDSFVYEFLYSSIAARVVYYCPIAIDAIACVGKRRGQAFLDFFGEVMTGVKPKSEFLQPGLIIEITFEMAKQFFIQYILMRKPLVPFDLGKAVVDANANKKQGSYA